MEVGGDYYGFYHRFIKVSQEVWFYLGDCGSHDSIWVIVDRMTKSTHYLSVKTTHLTKDYAKLYIQELLDFMGFQSPLLQTEVHNLLHSFWSPSKKVWVQKWT